MCGKLSSRRNVQQNLKKCADTVGTGTDELFTGLSTSSAKINFPINISVISNHNSFRVLFGKIASVYFIRKIYLYRVARQKRPELCVTLTARTFYGVKFPLAHL